MSAPPRYDKQALKSPAFEDYTPWTLENLKAVAGEVNEGNFAPLGKLEIWLNTNGRVGSCNNARLAGYLSDAVLTVEGGSEAEQALLRADFKRAFATLPTFDIITDLRFLCASLCQVRHLRDGLPWLQPWKIALLERRGADRWFVTNENSTGGNKILTPLGTSWVDTEETEIDLSPISTEWVLLGTERIRHPWHSFRAAWNIVAPLCIGGMNALVWWLRNAMHTSISPIIVETDGVGADDLTVFWKNMEDIGQMVYIESPFGKKLARLNSNPMDHTSPKELKQEIDMSIAEYLLGQSLSTRMDGGGSYAAVVAEIDRITAPLLRLELAQAADAFNDGWVPLWQQFRGIGSPMTLGWTVASLDDRLKESQIRANNAKTNSTGGK